MPLLPVHNQFACLEVEDENPPPPSLHAESPVKVTLKSKTTLTPCLLYLRQWERHLPKQYVVAATPGPKSLVIKVEIKTTDTAEVKSGPALIDCGATSQFMDHDYVEWNRLTTQKLQRAIPVFNVDGSPNEAGSITEIVDAILCYKGHMECTSFTVTSLGKQDIILGFTWLLEHNLEIDWRTQEVVMSHCPARYHMCQSKAWKEHQECQRVEQLIWMCCSGPHPLLSEEESEADSAPDSNTIPNSTSAPISELCSTSESEFIPTFNPHVVCLSPDDALTEGDHLLYVESAPILLVK